MNLLSAAALFVMGAFLMGGMHVIFNMGLVPLIEATPNYFPNSMALYSLLWYALPLIFLILFGLYIHKQGDGQ